MRVDLTDAQRALRAAGRAITTEKIDPPARALDRDETDPHTLIDERGDRRLTGLTLPETYGGRGAGLVEFALMIEELAAGLMSVASTIGLHLGVATAIYQFGTEGVWVRRAGVSTTHRDRMTLRRLFVLDSLYVLASCWVSLPFASLVETKPTEIGCPTVEVVGRVTRP